MAKPRPGNGKLDGLMGNVSKRRRDVTRWLEAERLEVHERESERPVGGKRTEFMRAAPAEEPTLAGVRASVVAMKRRNGCGAKGRREVDATGTEGCTNTTDSAARLNVGGEGGTKSQPNVT